MKRYRRFRANEGLEKFWNQTAGSALRLRPGADRDRRRGRVLLALLRRLRAADAQPLSRRLARPDRARPPLPRGERPLSVGARRASARVALVGARGEARDPARRRARSRSSSSSRPIRPTRARRSSSSSTASRSRRRRSSAVALPPHACRCPPPAACSRCDRASRSCRPSTRAGPIHACSQSSSSICLRRPDLAGDRSPLPHCTARARAS